MAQACVSPAFTYRGGVLGLSRAGVFREIASDYQESSNDGPFDALAFPGRIHNELDLSWFNDTGVAQWVVVEAERGPRIVIISSPNGAEFRERLTAAVGERAPEPELAAHTGNMTQIMEANANFLCPGVPARAMTSYWTQDRGTTSHDSLLLVQPGSTVNARLRVGFYTGTPWRTPTGENALNEARARWARLRMLAAPAGSGA